jgi:hypothetical protein
MHRVKYWFHEPLSPLWHKKLLSNRPMSELKRQVETMRRNDKAPGTGALKVTFSLELAAGSRQHNKCRAKQDSKVEPDAPVLYVLKITVNIVGKRGALPGFHLPQARNSWPYLKAAQMVDCILLVLAWERRTGTYQTHFAFEYITQLRQLIQAVLA